MGMEYYAAQSANKRVYGDGLSSPLIFDTRFSAFSITLNPGVIYVETEDEVMLKTATDFHPDYRYLLLEKLDRCSALRINDLRVGNARLRFSRFGSWVRITKGHYSGDLGRIVEFGVPSSHPADRPVWILVPARMRFHCASNSKCMTNLAPDGLPFAPKVYTYREVAKIVGESKVFFHGENTFEVFHHIFVNGLYALPAKSSEFRAISFADPAEAFIFAQSNVPVHDITNRAYLRTGDSVVIHDNCSIPELRGHSGKVIVRAINHLSVQLHHPTLEGVSRVFGLAYGDVHIQLTPGTWVSIEAGEHAGRTGVIVLVCQGRACLLSPNVDTSSFVELEDISGNFLRTLPPNLDVLRRGFFGCGQYPCCLERLIGHPVAIVGELYRGIGVLEYVWSSRATVRLRNEVYVALQLTDVISVYVLLFLLRFASAAKTISRDNWKTLMNAFSPPDGLQDHFLGSLTSENPVVWVFRGDHTGMGELVGFTDGVVLVWFPEKPNPRFQTVKADDVFSL